MADLFDQTQSKVQGQPLATRLRPSTLDDYVGQEHLLGPNSAIRTAIQEGKLGSVILWAPPGCGKTTLAFIIAQYSDAILEVRSAVTTGVAEVRKIAESATERKKLYAKSTILLLDEVHHFNKSQQDSLLGYLEDGVFSLVGATTENPFFALNSALLSRARVLPLKPLSEDNIKSLLDRALADKALGLGSKSLQLSTEARTFLVTIANGDARLALNGLESASFLSGGDVISLEVVEQVLQKQSIRYDKQGDFHYDTISAFIKSVRGSDADAALHYLARMIKAGEDPRFIMRRLLILASEDIGNADPQGLVVASAGLQAVSALGMPESRIILSQVTTYLAEAPKSNRSYLAIDKALADVERVALAPIPLHLRNAPTEGVRKLDHGKGYQYPHDFEGGWVSQNYLPQDDLETPYYDPSSIGYEQRIRDRRNLRNPEKSDD